MSVSIGRFTSRDHAEGMRAAFEKAHGPLAIVEREESAGEWTFLPVGVKPTASAPDSDQRDKFDLIPAEKFVARPQPEWLIDDVLPAAELAGVLGDRSVGKSPFMYSMACAIHLGVEWFGHDVRKGRAVYLTAEGGREFQNRINAYAIANDVPVSALPPMIDDVPNLKTAADAALIAHKVGKADVLFIDTFAASFLGNESAGDDVGPVLAHMKFISKKTGALVVCAFHPGKNLSLGIRGWSGIIAALDTEITIERRGEHRTAEVTKQKGGSERELFGFGIKVITVGETPKGKAITGVVIEPAEARPISHAKVHQFLGVNQKAIEKALRRLAPVGTALLRDLLAEALKYAPHDADDSKATAQKRKDIKKALDDLVAKPLVYLHGPDRVSLSSAIVPEIDPFDIPELPVTNIDEAASLAAALRI